MGFISEKKKTKRRIRRKKETQGGFFQFFGNQGEEYQYQWGVVVWQARSKEMRTREKKTHQKKNSAVIEKQNGKTGHSAKGTNPRISVVVGNPRRGEGESAGTCEQKS